DGVQVLGLDLSERSRPTLDAALQLLPDTRVFVVTAYDVPYSSRAEIYAFGTGLIEQHAIATHRALSDAQHQLATAAAGERLCGSVVMRGDPRKLLVEQVRSLDAAYLTLGGAGLRAIRRWPDTTFGEVIRAVVPATDVDVLVINRPVQNSSR
ncbi:MAG: universal stress protein, partial [Steroidobacteraceae bacterium]|nr:universal stress protein [Steroidobacteraceae bacterium]MDW8258179.1 universal stress protein [Gammaproteobacteria bacterium]